MAEYVTIRYRNQGRGKLVRVEGVWFATKDGVTDASWYAEYSDTPAGRNAAYERLERVNPDHIDVLDLTRRGPITKARAGELVALAASKQENPEPAEPR